MSEVISSPRNPRINPTTSPALKNGDFVFISGISSKNDIFDEALKDCFKQIQSLLREANHSLDDIVRITYYLKNKEMQDLLDQSIIEILHEPYPTRSIVYVDDLEEGVSFMIDIDSYHPRRSCSGCRLQGGNNE